MRLRPDRQPSRDPAREIRRAWLRRRRRVPTRPGLEALETRVVLSPTIYTVNATGNGTSGSGSSGTLPYVISLANADTNPDGSEVTFDPTVFSTPQTIALGEMLTLNESPGPEVIDGPGAGLLSISGQGHITPFITDNSTSLSGLTITDGLASFSVRRGIPVGGGIINIGYLTLIDCTISGNSGYGGGGGIINYEVATIVGCTISGNTAVSGAGVYDNDYTSGETTLTGCTISGNSSAFYGAGLFTSQVMTLTNCTISGNSAGRGGGGIADVGRATVTLTASTISGNTAASGGGLINGYPGTTTLTDTIVAGNELSTGGASDIADVSGGGVTGTFNLIGTGGSAGIVGGTDGNIVLTSLDGLNLGPLANNGGPTQTMALIPGNPAINAGKAVAGVTTDQRGQPLDMPPDIGAYQLQPGPPSVDSIVGQQPVFLRKLNKKGKPVGKAIMSGFTLAFGTLLDATAAIDPAHYQVDTVARKKVKKKVEHILHPIRDFTVSYAAASNAVTIRLVKPEKFPTGGQLTVLGGLTTASGGSLSGTAVFAISKGGKRIVPG